jgi:hypothetical protein
MTDDTAAQVLVLLGEMRSDMAACHIELHDRFTELNARLSSLAGNVELIHQGLVAIHGDLERITVRLDHLDGRIARIEHRLDLSEAS